MMNWLKNMTGIPAKFEGVIQDSASTATLCSILTAREKALKYKSNNKGLQSHPVLRVYCSIEAHSSVEKAVKIAGLGRENLVKIAVNNEYSMDLSHLQAAIKSDIEAGMIPLCVVAALGTTGSTAIDPLDSIGDICNEYGIWLHVDAAYSGSALILPHKHFA